MTLFPGAWRVKNFQLTFTKDGGRVVLGLASFICEIQWPSYLWYFVGNTSAVSLYLGQWRTYAKELLTISVLIEINLIMGKQTWQSLQPQRKVSTITVLLLLSFHPILVHSQTTECARGQNGWAAGPGCTSVRNSYQLTTPC